MALMNQLYLTQQFLHPYKHIVFLFSGFAVVSYIYAIITGKYNGDFLGTEVLVGNPILTFNLLTTLAPLFLLWSIFKRFKIRELSEYSRLIPNWFLYFSFFLVVLNIFITLLFGVGIANSPVYAAPDFLTPFIQISLRFNPFFFSFIVILSTKNKPLGTALVVLTILLSVLRSSLGVFLFLSLLFIIKHHFSILRFIRKKFILAVVLVVLAINSAYGLFLLRADLRGGGREELSVAEFAVGRLIGRLSSFPNSAMIIQEAPYLGLVAVDYSTHFPVSQALGGVISGSLIPENRPEISLYQLNNSGEQDSVASFMVGVNGVLYFSIFKSWISLILSVFLYLFFIYSTLWLAYASKRKYVLDVTYLSLIYLCVSGVLNEFGYLFTSVLLVFIIFKFNKFLSSFSGS